MSSVTAGILKKFKQFPVHILPKCARVMARYELFGQED
jgi:hypothetical protein